MGSKIRDIPLHRGLTKVLIDEATLARRVAELGREIGEFYHSREPILIGVLTGAVVFMADLARAMEIPLTMEFLAISSYGNATRSSGVVRILKDLNHPIEGKPVLVVEDIIDSGLTLDYLLDLLQRRNPSEIRVATLLLKQRARQIEVKPDWVGFEIPDEFVVGYGLDYAGRYRNLPFIGIGSADAIAS